MNEPFCLFAQMIKKSEVFGSFFIKFICPSTFQ
nr:MAG TPA: hypothetical protein [Caudoviricetes sp.]